MFYYPDTHIADKNYILQPRTPKLLTILYFNYLEPERYWQYFLFTISNQTNVDSSTVSLPRTLNFAGSSWL